MTTIERYDEDVMRLFPGIPWREPVHIVIIGGVEGWGCRLCIARLGLKAREASNSSAFVQTLSQFQAHLEQVHGGR